MSEETKIPNPGSDEALDMGCRCPVLDNAHGKGRHWQDGGLYWINEECDLHAPAPTPTPNEEEG